MRSLRTSCAVLGALVLFGAGARSASAQAVPDPDPNKQTTLGAGTPPASLPPPRSDNDPRPPVPAPTVPQTGVTRQAGVGGTQAYARSGVLELGGSAGFSTASSYSRFELSPSIGLFLVDNVELSLLGVFNYFNIGSTSTAPSSSATELKALVEPSFHLPFSQVAVGVLGLGAGVNYVTGHQAGFALQP